MVRFASRCLLSILMFCLVGSFAWAGSLQDENLLVSLPKNFKVAARIKKNGMDMQEWIPKEDDLSNWSEIITVQVFLGKRNFETEKFLRMIEMQWLSFCKGSKPQEIKTEKANGYVVSTMQLNCPVNSKTGRPETTLFRAIKGNDSFYIVQKAWKSNPSSEQIAEGVKYLKTVTLCDSRSPEHPCPDLEAQGFVRQ